MEADELSRIQKALYIHLLGPFLMYVIIICDWYFMLGGDFFEKTYNDNLTYMIESGVLLFSLFAFWLSLRMLSNKSMVIWIARHTASSYLSLALIRSALMHTVIMLGLVTRLVLHCPTTHWLCVLGIIGLLFIIPTKRRIIEESQLIEEIRNLKE